MKSLKIAALGVAALGFAAAPAFGAFAADPSAGTATTNHTDAIRINVLPSCTLGTFSTQTGKEGTYANDDATTHPTTSGATQGEWLTTTAAFTTNGNGKTDQLTITMLPGTSNANIGQTQLVVRCNNTLGYDVIAESTGLLKDVANVGDDIETDTDFGDDDASYWNFKLSVPASTEDGFGMVLDEAYVDGTVYEIPTGEGGARIAGKAASGNIAKGEYLDITYGAGISKSQASGTYEGSVKYTLIQVEEEDDD